jgi:hypothetical protein
MPGNAQLETVAPGLSKTVPNIVVVRCADVIAHAVGELPATELATILGAATRGPA